MKIMVVYRPNSEHGRQVEEFAHEFTRRYPDNRVELLNIDGREGYSTASLYDIVQYPTVLALRDDGSILNEWIGSPLPLLDEVAGYTVNS